MKGYKLALLLAAFIAGFVGTAGAAPLEIRELIVLGLEKNIGLQVERISLPLSAEEIRANASVFDSELFATAGYAQSSSPQSSAVSSADSFDSDQLSGQFGLRKGYETGLTAAVSLASERISDNSQLEVLDPRYRTALLLDLTQPLLRNFGSAVNTTQLQLSRNQRQQAHFSYFLQAQSLALQVETLALQYARDLEIVSFRRQAVQLAETLHAANQQRFSAGVIPVTEVQEAETDLANRELNLSLALQAQELSLEQLNRYLDYSLPVEFSIAAASADAFGVKAQPKSDLPEFEQLFAAARQQRLDLKISEIDIENSSLQKNYAANQQLPQLDLKLQGGLNGLSGASRSSTTSSAYAGRWGNSFSSMSAADGYQWRAGLEFSLPLENRAANARLRQAQLRERQANYRKRDQEAALKMELQQQLTILQRAAEQFAIASRFATLAEKSLQQEQRRLDEGLSDTFRIILFKTNMINAKIDRITALTQYQLAAAKMNFSRGIILEQHGITVRAEAEEADFETL